MWTRLAFFGIAFVAIVAFAISMGENLGEQNRQAYILGLQGKLAQSSCQPPASGCPEGKYWDSSECQCRSESSGSSCQEPGGGCPNNYGWDNDICNCVYEGSTTSSSPSISPLVSPTPTYFDDDDFSSSGDGGIGGTPIYDESTYVDRLAQVDFATMNCIRTRLNDTEFDLFRFLVPSNEDQFEELRRIEEKAKICFESYYEVKKIEEASREISEFSDDVEACLKVAVGVTAYNKVSSGLREPTQEERRRGERCFEGEYKSEIRYQTSDTNLVVNINSCLRLALGEGQFEDINSGVAYPTIDERQKAERCFGASPQPFQARPTYKIPGDIDACLRGSVGLGRYEEIKSGRSEPTEVERVRGESCFDNLNETQVSFLPAPPEQIPYLVENSKIIEVGGVGQKIVQVSPGIIDNILVLSGTGLPNSIVDIYIFSEPIVVTTTTDENGDWIYELNQPLEGETHVAYATIRNQSGDIVRSSIFDFTVAAAVPGAGELLREEEKAAQETARFLTYALVLTATVVLLAGGGGAYLFLKKSGPVRSVSKKVDLSSDRNSKGDTGSGSVN